MARRPSTPPAAPKSVDKTTVDVRAYDITDILDRLSEGGGVGSNSAAAQAGPICCGVRGGAEAAQGFDSSARNLTNGQTAMLTPVGPAEIARAAFLGGYAGLGVKKLWGQQWDFTARVDRREAATQLYGHYRALQPGDLTIQANHLHEKRNLATEQTDLALSYRGPAVSLVAMVVGQGLNYVMPGALAVLGGLDVAQGVRRLAGGIWREGVKYPRQIERARRACDEQRYAAADRCVEIGRKMAQAPQIGGPVDPAWGELKGAHANATKCRRETNDEKKALDISRKEVRRTFRTKMASAFGWGLGASGGAVGVAGNLAMLGAVPGPHSPVLLPLSGGLIVAGAATNFKAHGTLSRDAHPLMLAEASRITGAGRVVDSPVEGGGSRAYLVGMQENNGLKTKRETVLTINASDDKQSVAKAFKKDMKNGMSVAQLAAYQGRRNVNRILRTATIGYFDAVWARQKLNAKKSLVRQAVDEMGHDAFDERLIGAMDDIRSIDYRYDQKDEAQATGVKSAATALQRTPERARLARLLEAVENTPLLKGLLVKQMAPDMVELANKPDRPSDAGFLHDPTRERGKIFGRNRNGEWRFFVPPRAREQKECPDGVEVGSLWKSSWRWNPADPLRTLGPRYRPAEMVPTDLQKNWFTTANTGLTAKDWQRLKAKGLCCSADADADRLIAGLRTAFANNQDVSTADVQRVHRLLTEQVGRAIGFTQDVAGATFRSIEVHRLMAFLEVEQNKAKYDKEDEAVHKAFLEKPLETIEVGQEENTMMVPSIVCEACRDPVETAVKAAVPGRAFTLHVRGNEQSKLIFNDLLSDKERQRVLDEIDDVGHEARIPTPASQRA